MTYCTAQIGRQSGCALQRLISNDGCKVVRSDNPSKPLCSGTSDQRRAPAMSAGGCRGSSGMAGCLDARIPARPAPGSRRAKRTRRAPARRRPCRFPPRAAWRRLPMAIVTVTTAPTTIPATSPRFLATDRAIRAGAPPSRRRPRDGNNHYRRKHARRPRANR
jgi:hypothetical protein